MPTMAVHGSCFGRPIGLVYPVASGDLSEAGDAYLANLPLQNCSPNSTKQGFVPVHAIFTVEDVDMNSAELYVGCDGLQCDGRNESLPAPSLHLLRTHLLCSNTSNNTQRRPETPKDIQQNPMTPSDTQRHPTTPNDAQQHPTTPNDIQQHPMTPNNTYICHACRYKDHGRHGCAICTQATGEIRHLKVDVEGTFPQSTITEVVQFKGRRFLQGLAPAWVTPPTNGVYDLEQVCSCLPLNTPLVTPSWSANTAFFLT